MSDMMPTRPPMYPPMYEVPTPPWAAPDPAHRHTGEPPRPSAPSGPGGFRRFLAVAVVLLIGLVLGLGGAAIIDHNRGQSRSSATTLPARQLPPSTQGGTSPATDTPSSSSPSSQQVTSSTASLSEGVVNIDTVLAYDQAEAAGTGMILTADGDVVTNNHVIDGATGITATVVSTGKTYKATVVGTDPSHDVAVIHLQNASGLTPANFGDSSKVAVGDAVTAVGNAGGRGTPTVASGHVTALGQEITASDRDGSNPEQLKNLIQVDANLQAGESGGPLYDAQGKVVGMNTAGGSTGSFRFRSNEGYAIPIDDALTIARQIQAGQDTADITIGTPGFLGVEVQESSDGVVVAGVVNGTAADKIGLQQGDVLTKVAGKDVKTLQDLSAALENHHEGDKVDVTWTGADGQSHSATATLGQGRAN